MKDFPIWYIIPKVIYSITDSIQSGCIMYILIGKADTFAPHSGSNLNSLRDCMILQPFFYSLRSRSFNSLTEEMMISAPASSSSSLEP